MPAVLDLVTDALNEIGLLASGETATADDGWVGLRALNRMVDAWKAERVFIYQVARSTWSIVSGTGSYTVGTGGNVNIVRPVRIDSIAISDSSITPPYEIPLRMMTDADYAGIRIKTQQALRPSAAWYNLTFPTATLVFWPVPTSSTLLGVLYAPQAVDEFAALADTVILPPGYRRMIVKNLGLELAPQYGATVSPQLERLERQAQDSFAVVVRANKRLQDLKFEPGALMSRRLYDIYSDQT
jgi:hypothetical protein